MTGSDPQRCSNRNVPARKRVTLHTKHSGAILSHSWHQTFFDNPAGVNYCFNMSPKVDGGASTAASSLWASFWFLLFSTVVLTEYRLLLLHLESHRKTSISDCFHSVPTDRSHVMMIACEEVSCSRLASIALACVEASCVDCCLLANDDDV